MGELCAERDFISFPIKKPCKNRVVQHSQAATRGHRQPRQQGLPSLPGRMEHLQVPPASGPPCSLLTGKQSCSFPALLGKGIGQLESGKERKDLDFCKGWSGEMRHWECFPESGSFGGMSAGIAVRNFPVTLAPKPVSQGEDIMSLFPAFSTRTFLLFSPSQINKPGFEQSLWVLWYLLQSSWHLFAPTKGLPACPGLK